MLPENVQIQIIADMVNGIEGERRVAEEFGEKWRPIYQAALEAPETEDRLGWVEAALRELPDEERMREKLNAALDGRDEIDCPTLAELRPHLKPVRWVWKKWLPYGLISVLAAVSGAGKTWVALDLARRVIAGEPWPDGTPMPEDAAGRDVLYVDAENIPDVLNERWAAWGADASRLRIMRPEPYKVLDLLDPQYQERLLTVLWKHHPALMVVDSLGMISSRGENHIEDVREVLTFLQGAAAEYDCGLLLNHHTRKRSPLAGPDGELTLDDIRGSGHIIHAGRAVLGLDVVQTGPEPSTNAPRRLKVLKSTAGPKPEAVGFELASLPEGGMYLKWGGAPTAYRTPTVQGDCGAWLLATMRERGEMRPRELVAMAEEAGYNKRVLYRARAELNGRIKDTLGRKNPRNCWALAEED